MPIIATSLVIGTMIICSAAQGQELETSTTNILNVNSPSLPDHYMNEIITFSCSFRLDEPPNSPVQFLTITPVGVSPGVFIGCTLVSTPDGSTAWTQINYQPESVHTVVDVGALVETCKNLQVETSLQFDITVKVTVKQTAEYQCLLKTEDKKELRSTSYKINEIKEPPTGLSLFVEPSTELFVDETFSFRCESSGGNPPSEFQYGIGDVVVNDDSHTSSKLHNGRAVWCEDTAHMNLNGGETEATKQRQHLSIYYLNVNMVERNRTFNPTHTYTINCDSDYNLPENVSLMYKWFEAGSQIPNETDEMLMISSRVNATPTTFSCLVYSNDGEFGTKLGEKEITYFVIWDEEATPSPTTTMEVVTKADEKDNGKTEEVKDSKDMTTVIIIVGIVVAVVILIIIVIIIVKKRQGQSGSADIKKAQTRDAEHGNEVEASEPMLRDGEEKPIEKSRNN